MTVHEKILSQVDKLSISERILIVESIWDSILDSQESPSVTDEQKSELDKRLKDYKGDPNNGSSWTNTKKRIQSKL